MVLTSVIFGLISAIALGTADVAAAAVVRRLGVLRTTFLSHFCSIAITTTYLFVAWDLGVISLTQWAQLAGLSVLGATVTVAFYRALQLGPLAVVSPVTSAYAVVVVLLAVAFVGERLSAGQAVAVAATIGGVALASINIGDIRSGRGIGPGVLIALVITVGIGVWIYSIGVLAKEIGWFLPIYVSRLFTLAMLGPASAIRRDWPWQRLTVPLALGVVVVGVLETGSLLAFARGSEIGVISIVAAASTTYPIVPILGGLVVFRERLGPTQLFGLAVVVAGLVMLGLNS